jgi:hypothetical protein
MEHKKQLEDLHKESLAKADDYLKNKKGLKEEDIKKLHTAREKWIVGWNEFLETIAYLDTLEI